MCPGVSWCASLHIRFAFTVIIDRSVSHAASSPRPDSSADSHKQKLWMTEHTIVDHLKDLAFQSTQQMVL